MQLVIVNILAVVGLITVGALIYILGSSLWYYWKHSKLPPTATELRLEYLQKQYDGMLLFQTDMNKELLERNKQLEANQAQRELDLIEFIKGRRT